MENREKQRDIPEKVRDLVDKIAADYKPEKIVLFGSYAWGETHEWSDVDLLIIKDTETKRTRRAEEALRGLHKRLIPIDVIIVTPEELEWVLKKKVSFIGKILEDGIVVYEH